MTPKNSCRKGLNGKMSGEVNCFFHMGQCIAEVFAFSYNQQCKIEPNVHLATSLEETKELESVSTFGE